MKQSTHCTYSNVTIEVFSAGCLDEKRIKPSVEDEGKQDEQQIGCRKLVADHRDCCKS